MSEPVDPNLAPPPGSYAPPPPPPGSYAPPPQPQPAGYTPQPAPPSQPAWSDPLFVPPGSSFGAWYNKVIEIVKRSWRSVLMITGVGIALPAGIVSLVSWLSYGYYATSATLLFHMGTLFDTGQLLFGAFITFVFAVAAFFVSAVAWAAAVYTITLEANGERPSLNAAFNYGLKRAGSLWLWTIVVALIVAVGTCLLILPGIYAAFALSLFGFVVIFERDQNPIARSFKLTHADLGSTLGKVAVLAVAIWVFELIVNAIFGSIENGIISNGFVGFDFSFGARFGVGIVSLISDLVVVTPVTGLLVMAMLPIYAGLRAREIQLSTPALRQQLG
jgi:hypothetical protein